MDNYKSLVFSNNFIALALSCISCNVQTSKTLIELGADPNLGTTVGQTTMPPISMFARSGNKIMVELLLKHKVSLDSASILRFASQYDLEILKLLLEGGADPSRPDKF